jgi:hypothetical protein
MIFQNEYVLTTNGCHMEPQPTNTHRPLRFRFSVAFSSDGSALASGSDDATVKLWDVQTGKELQTLTCHSGLVYSVAFSSDRSTLASGSPDDTINSGTSTPAKSCRHSQAARVQFTLWPSHLIQMVMPFLFCIEAITQCNLILTLSYPYQVTGFLWQVKIYYVFHPSIVNLFPQLPSALPKFLDTQMDWFLLVESCQIPEYHLGFYTDSHCELLIFPAGDTQTEENRGRRRTNTKKKGGPLRNQINNAYLAVLKNIPK